MLCAEFDFAENASAEAGLFDTAFAENSFTVADGWRGRTRFVSHREIEALLESAGYSDEEIDYDWAGAETETAGSVLSWVVA
ncbi:hypothetical protein R80B4_02334 [Fibrobacteres bacterium R8-0-B4]